MQDRRVTRSRKHVDGDITAVSNPTEPWSPRHKQDVIDDITRGRATYFVLANGHRVALGVVEGPKGAELRTDSGPRGRDLLYDLPDC